MTGSTAVVKQNKTALDSIKKEVVDVVESKVATFIQTGYLNLPPNYSPYNAMKAAWLQLQSIEDKNGNLVLTSCTRTSIANALLDMVVQGLNPSKKQCYFIAYGDKLICQRSYFGTMAVCKNVTGAKDIFAEVVYEDDDFVYEILRSRKIVRRHIQELKNIKPGKIVAAYCVIMLDDDREFTEIMTMGQIKKAWEKSKMNPDKDGSVHKDFAEEMCKRTVINRACKKYINSSSDSNILLGHFNRADDEIEEKEIEDEIAENANSQVIDIEHTVDNDGFPDGPPLDSEPLDEPLDIEDSGQQTIGGPGF